MLQRDDTLKRELARTLRASGKTYAEIQDELRVAACTLCGWIKDIKLTEAQQEAIQARSRPARRARILKLSGSGHLNPNWKGGITRSNDGYVYVHAPDHHRAAKSGYAKRSDLVAETMLGRELKPEEIVHHRNEIKSDDRPENLEVMASTAEHTKLYSTGKFKVGNKVAHGSKPAAPKITCTCRFCGAEFVRLRRDVRQELVFCNKACSARFFHALHGHAVKTNFRLDTRIEPE